MKESEGYEQAENLEPQKQLALICLKPTGLLYNTALMTILCLLSLLPFP